MNMSEIVSALIMSNGLYNITLPFKDPKTKKTVPTEQVVQNTIETVTIPMFSTFVPWRREGMINIKDLIKVEGTQHDYYLPKWLTLTPVRYVIDVHLPFINQRGTYGDIAPAYGINRSVQGVATSMAYMMVASQMRAEPTWDYLGHNKIRLFGWPLAQVEMVVACNHLANGESIPDGCYESFMSLAELDVKILLYNTLKYYHEIPTAFGNVNLRIEDYQPAIEEKKALLKEWGDVAHLDMGWETWM